MSEAVRPHAEDVNKSHLGCFLSGGTASSSVLGLLERHKGNSVNAFSIGFSEERFNELEYARIAASAFHASHSIAVLTPEETFADIATIVGGYDEPFGNASVLPTYACLKLARKQGVAVMLAGDGGDELFGGNERYRTERVFGIYHHGPPGFAASCDRTAGVRTACGWACRQGAALYREDPYAKSRALFPMAPAAAFSARARAGTGNRAHERPW